MKTSLFDLLKWLILALFVYLFFLIFKPFLSSFVLALVFAMVFYPLLNQLMIQFKLKAALAAFFTVLLTLIFNVFNLFLLVLLLGREAASFSQSIDVEQWRQSLVLKESIEIWSYELPLGAWRQSLMANLQEIGVYLSSKSLAIASSLSRSLFLFFVFILLYYYFLKDASFLIPELKKRLPYSATQQEQLFRSFRSIAQTLFYGNFISALVAGIIAYVGFWAFGFKGALIWALLAAVLSFIPTAGTFLLYALGIGIVTWTSGGGLGILMALYFVGAELFLRENWIKPKLMEDKLNLHPILVFFALVGGVGAFGSMGLIYGPLIVTFLGALWQFYGEEN